MKTFEGLCRVSAPISKSPENIRSIIQKPYENVLRVSRSRISLNQLDLKKDTALVIWKPNLIYLTLIIGHLFYMCINSESYKKERSDTIFQSTSKALMDLRLASCIMWHAGRLSPRYLRVVPKFFNHIFAFLYSNS